MLIISPFKDLYDYLPHIYGVDNKVIYDRNYVISIEEKDHLTIKNFINEHHTDIFTRFYLSDRSMEMYRRKIFGFLIILGQFVPVIGTSCNDRAETMSVRNYFTDYKFEFCNHNNFTEYSEEVIEYSYNIYKSKNNNRVRLYYPPKEKLLTWLDKMKDRYYPELMEIQDKYNQPIMSSFWIHYNKNLFNYNVPILSSVKDFNKKFPEDKLYQDIYNFFIKNKKNEDLLPPVEVDNTSKIEKAGFDKKTSFRHPVK